MTEHLSFDQLCDSADGALAGAMVGAVSEHLGACGACAAQLTELTQLNAAAAALPREIQPPADLWLDIERDLVRSRRLAVHRAWPVRYLAAAAVVVAVASSALTAVVMRNRTASSSDVAPAPSAVTAAEPVAVTLAALPERLAIEESGYARSALILQRTLDERRDSLAPSTIAIVERSLRVADSAIAEAREALARDPANAALARLFASNYERKIDLLRRATELAPRT